MAERRVVCLEAARKTFGERADEVARWFFVGDPEWPTEPPDRVTPPPWLDEDRCNRGGLVLRRHGVLSAAVLRSFSLPLSYTSALGVRPLVATGRLVDEAPARLYRTAEFVLGVQRWGSFARGGPGWRATATIRTVHQRVRTSLRARGWPEHLGAPLPQPDVAATALLFGPVLVQGLRRLGAAISADEADDVAHLARAIAHGQGVVPSLQADGHEEAMHLFALLTALNHPPEEESRALMRALLDVPLQLAREPLDHLLAPFLRHFYASLSAYLLGEDTARSLGVDDDDRWGRLVRKVTHPAFHHPRLAPWHDRTVALVMARGQRRLSPARTPGSATTPAASLTRLGTLRLSKSA